MAIAVQIKTLDSGGNPDGGIINFEQYEVMHSQSFPKHNISVRRSQNGKPTMFKLNDYTILVNVLVRIYGESTQGKLTTIRNHSRKELGFRVYMQYIENSAFYRDCYISPEIPIDFAFAGEYKAGNTYNLNFIRM